MRRPEYGVVPQVGADAGEVRDAGDGVAREGGAVADAGDLEELGGLDRAGGEDDAAARGEGVGEGGRAEGAGGGGEDGGGAGRGAGGEEEAGGERVGVDGGRKAAQEGGGEEAAGAGGAQAGGGVDRRGCVGGAEECAVVEAGEWAHAEGLEGALRPRCEGPDRLGEGDLERTAGGREGRWRLGVGGVGVQARVKWSILWGFLVVGEDVGKEVGGVIYELCPFGKGVDCSPGSEKRSED